MKRVVEKTEDVLLSAAEAAKLLGVDVSTVAKWRRTRRIPAAAVVGYGPRMFRFYRSALVALRDASVGVVSFTR